MVERIRLEDRECPLSSTLGLVGEWWTLLILHDAFDGYSRFDQFQENLGISSSLLTGRLKRLVASGLLERRQYQAHPPRYEYVLTELGRSLRPLIVVLAGWGNARLAPDQRSMVLVDAQTGAEAEPVVVDRATGRRIDGPDFVFTAGPAASKPFRDRYEGRPEPRKPARRGKSPRGGNPPPDPTPGERSVAATNRAGTTRPT
jgi:DNA-binding HxlR family transcriptional regulator